MMAFPTAGAVWPFAQLACFSLGAVLASEGVALADEGLVAHPLAPRSVPAGATMFTALAPADTAVVTENNYAEASLTVGGPADPRQRSDRYHEFAVGSIGTGVAIADFDGDGRPDLFVVSKTESCRMFRNLGGWKFEDVTARAGVGDAGPEARIWKGGATIADVNNDGQIDLYLCRFGAPNRLYVNQGNGTFRDEAAARGLALNDASVVGAFADYDRDGWVDVYVQTNLLDATARPRGQPDHLFHNNGDGTFTDVSATAGVGGDTQGHSATWWDFDNDGWPDLYVADDFAAPDKLYRNNRNGTFTDVIDRVVPHMPYSSMGADLGDVNNDGRIDFLVADMATTTTQKDQRTMAAARAVAVEPPDDSPAAPQYPRNALYLNTGRGRFQEAAFLAGVAATDWTWAPRFEDFDNDGRLDLVVTNGMHHEVHNVDLIQRIAAASSPAERARIERSSPVLIEENLAYRNLGGLEFEETGRAWGLGEKGVSFGLATGDLDGDGDLDVVYTNYRKCVTVLRNDSPAGHRLVVELHATRSNRLALGATVRVETAAGVQIRPLVCARGVLSSSQLILHFGLGEESRVLRLRVTWPTGETQTFADLAADQHYVITEPGVAGPANSVPAPAKPLFTEETARFGLAVRAREAPFDELGSNPLQPVRFNRRGPALAVGDLDGDGADEIVLGGTTRDAARVLAAGADGRFTVRAGSSLGAPGETDDGPVLVFDANGDGANDVLVTRGGVALPPGAPGYQPQLWLNDGRGALKLAPDALPALPHSVGAAAAADFDRDGRLDLFIGGRVVPGLYPLAPQSALLANHGGSFVDVTDAVAPSLRTIGLATAALWRDVDDDGWPDLVVALEWGRVRYLHNDQGRGFTDATEAAGFATAGIGWWSALAAGDFNRDGRMDIPAGNVGLNTQYRATTQEPAVLYVGDFGGSSDSQLVEARHEAGRLVPWRTRPQLGAAIPSILRRFPRNDAYARASLGELVGEDRLAAAQRLEATELRSGVFLSQPDGRYRFVPLPRVAQIAPIGGFAVADFDGDGATDLVAIQNSYAPSPVVGRFDGGVGQFLRGDGRGGFEAVSAEQSGVIIAGDAKAVAVVDLDRDGAPDFVVSRNNDTALAFRNTRPAGK